MNVPFAVRTRAIHALCRVAYIIPGFFRRLRFSRYRGIATSLRYWYGKSLLRFSARYARRSPIEDSFEGMHSAALSIIILPIIAVFWSVGTISIVEGIDSWDIFSRESKAASDFNGGPWLNVGTTIFFFLSNGSFSRWIFSFNSMDQSSSISA